MINLRVHIVLFLVALAVLLAVVSLAAKTSHSQSPNATSRSRVKATALKEGRNSPTANATSLFAAAAARNAVLQHELTWTFGGKQQRGWYLYDQLIRRTLNTQSDTNSPAFAVAVAAWQKKAGLTSSGELDENSLMAMVKQWQNNRLKSRTLADPSQLVLVPTSDFYDPLRSAELRQVERDTYAAYRKMMTAALADRKLGLAKRAGELAPQEKYFKIISSFRSREYQDRLRRESPNAGSAGLAVNSPHFTGRALDIYVGGDPVDTRDSNRAVQVNSPVYKWLVRNAERFGFRPYFYEPWHWEYVR